MTMTGMERPSLEEVREAARILRRRRRMRRVARTLLYVLLVLVMLLVASGMTVARPLTMKGTSMSPLVAEGDTVLVNMIGYVPARGDVAAVTSSSGETLIRQVAAVGGDTVSLDINGSVRVNGTQVHEGSAGLGLTAGVVGDITVPEGEVFLLSLEDGAEDSRTPGVGTIPANKVMGCVWLRLWPDPGKLAREELGT